MIKINEAKPDPNWRTIKGTHVRVNKKGQIVDGPDNLKNLNPAESSKNKSSGSKSSTKSKSSSDSSDDNPLADLIAKGITDTSNLVGNNLRRNLSHHN